MAIAGNWKAQQNVPYATNLKQGYGLAAVEGIRGGPGRATASSDTLDSVPTDIVDQFQPEQWGYSDEDVSSALYGYGTETGTSDRPNWGTEVEDGTRAGVPEDWPSFGTYTGGGTGGTFIRSQDHGSEVASVNEKQVQPPGLLNDGYKRSGDVEDAVTSDPAQYEMQTSMTQRDKTRSGSQVPSGRANALRASIKSRITGQRVPTYSGGYRHAEMEPKSQDLIIRPFRYRTAGTGPQAWMLPNALYVSEGLERVPVDDPYVNPIPTDSVSAVNNNYVDEDQLPYV